MARQVPEGKALLEPPLENEQWAWGLGSVGLESMARQVPEGKALLDPPLLRLEVEAGHAYLSLLLHLHSAASP